VRRADRRRCPHGAGGHVPNGYHQSAPWQAMARAQVVPKKGRNSSSAKKGRPADRKRRSARRPAGRPRRSTGRATTGRQDPRGAGAPSPRPRSGGRALTAKGTGLKPEASQPPTLVAPDATVAEQRRAASRQPDGARTNRPRDPTNRKPGARGGGDHDREAARRMRRGDALEAGRQDLTVPTRESTRGARPRGGEQGRIARARRATPRGDSRSAGNDRRRPTNLHESSPST
jgi:hypothetical protein